MKSERLKKLESELQDLEQWMKLGLVPKKEVERHMEEISNLKGRIEEEKERLQFLKESGELEEYITPRRQPAKTVFPETPSITDIELGEETAVSEPSMEMETEAMEVETSAEEEKGGGGGGDEEAPEEEEAAEEAEEEEDPFSDRNRWKRGGIMDPDATEW